MATGDKSDLVGRLRSLLPPWFPSQGSAPVIDGVLTGIAALLAGTYALIQYARAQSRISTATGAWLDLIAWDFFGARFQRRSQEIDAQFTPRILAELLRPRVTRAAIIKVATDLTGFQPSVIEAFNGIELGGLDCGNLALDTAGGFGATNQNNQIFITAFRPVSYGLAIVGGLDAGPGGLDAGLLELVDPQELPSAVTDAEITASILATIAAGVNPTIVVTSPKPSLYWDKPGMKWDQPNTKWL